MGRRLVPGWVWALLVLAHAAAFCWVIGAHNWDFPDSDRYLKAAENLKLHGELYSRPWSGTVPQGQDIQEFTIRTVGYPLVVMGLTWGKVAPGALLVFQNLLSLLNIGLVLGWWARRTQPARRHWLVVLAGLLTFPAQLIYANAVMSEILLQTVVLLLVWAAMAFMRTLQTRYLTWAVIAMVMALLIKPVFYPLAVVLAVMGLGLAGWARKLKLALLALVPLLVVGLYMGWNEHRTGYFHFSSIAEINLLHYNAAGVVRQTAGPAAEEQWVAGVLQEAAAQPDFAARQRLIQQRAGAVLLAHPVVYAQQHALGMLTFFLDPGRFDISHVTAMAEPKGGGMLAQLRAGGLLGAIRNLPVGLLTVLATVLAGNAIRLLLAVRGFWRLGGSSQALRRGRWVALGLLVYVAGLTGPLGAARFLVPVWPLLLGLALVGLQWPGRGPLGAEETPPVGEHERQG